MKVYTMKLILGKRTDYDQNGKLRNQVITPKYDEFELSNILEDDNWKKLGVCEIECLRCIDYTSATKTEKKIIVENVERKDEVNVLIKGRIKALIKPRSEVDLLREEIKELKESLIVKAPKAGNVLEIACERVVLESKANELEIKFRANIGDEKLLAKIVEVEPDFKL